MNSRVIFRWPVRAGLPCAALLLASCGGLENPPLIQAGAPTGEIEFVNSGSHPVVDLRIVPARADGRMPGDYGFDRLDGQVIPVGQSRRITASQGCYAVRSLAGPNTSMTMTRRERFGISCVAPGHVVPYVIQDESAGPGGPPRRAEP